MKYLFFLAGALTVSGCGLSATDEPLEDAADAELAASAVTLFEILGAFGPYATASSGSLFYNVYVSSPTNLSDHCLASEPEVITLTGANVSYALQLSCVVPLLGFDQIVKSGWGPQFDKFDQLGHDYFDYGKTSDFTGKPLDPNYANPDKNSPRWLSLQKSLPKGGIIESGSAGVYSTPQLASFYWQSSPLGEKALYWVKDFTCGYASTPEGLAAIGCTSSALKRQARTWTAGPRKMKLNATDSKYFDGDLIPGSLL